MARKGTFSKDNQPADKRGKSVRTKMLEALKRAGDTEADFYDNLYEKAMSTEGGFYLNEWLKRFSPLEKQVAPMIEFEFTKDLPAHKQAAQVMNAVSQGLIPPDIGATFISSIKSMIDIEESTELKKRIEQLEKQLGL